MGTVEREHTLSCVVENHPGVLARVAGSFADKGINIRSLTVAEINIPTLSRMTIVVRCNEETLHRVIEHLKNLEDVVEVEDIDAEDLVERELLLVRVKAKGRELALLMEILEVFDAAIVGMGTASVSVEMSGTRKRVDALVKLLQQHFEILEMARTGRVAIEQPENR